MHFSATTERVTRNTTIAINEDIAAQTEENLQYYATHPEEIDARLHELDREWDVERALEAHAAGISIVGVILGMFVDRKWFALPAIVGGFLMQHVISGWSPPLPVLRRAGVRTQTEIERERYALKALRGDFSPIIIQEDRETLPRRILEAVK